MLNIIVILVLLILFVYLITFHASKENLDEIQGRYCPDCNSLSFGQCIRCYNCRFKAHGYKGKCVNGSIMKPQKDDNRYYYNDTFWRDINDTRQCLYY